LKSKFRRLWNRSKQLAGLTDCSKDGRPEKIGFTGGRWDARVVRGCRLWHKIWNVKWSKGVLIQALSFEGGAAKSGGGTTRATRGRTGLLEGSDACIVTRLPQVFGWRVGGLKSDGGGMLSPKVRNRPFSTAEEGRGRERRSEPAAAIETSSLFFGREDRESFAIRR